MMKAILLVLFMIASLWATSQKKTAPQHPAKGPEASELSLTIEHNGSKTVISGSQFETAGGTVIPNGTGPSVMLNYGASNSKKNDASFSWMFTVPKPEKGVYQVGERINDGPATSLIFNSTAFPDVPMFLCKAGSIEITSSEGRFVSGSFSVVLSSGVTSGGQPDGSAYNVSGAFKILRL